jgi:hypothetical protein
LICCGRDDGTYGPVTWAEADEFRESYCTGIGVFDECSGLTHVRSAIIEPVTTATRGEG